MFAKRVPPATYAEDSCTPIHHSRPIPSIILIRPQRQTNGYPSNSSTLCTLGIKTNVNVDRCMRVRYYQ